MVNSSEFGKRLQNILDFYGITATELSNQISFNRSTISHLLSGRNKPSLDFVMKLLEKFPEVELYWLLNGKGAFPVKKEETPSSTSLEQKESIQDNLSRQQENQLKRSINPSKLAKTLDQEEIERIVFFFKDGSFKSFKN